MSGDETMVLLGSVVLGGAFLLSWYMPMLQSRQSHYASAEFLGLAAVPPLALAAVYFVIVRAGSLDVRNAPPYILLYCLLGVVWFLGAAYAMRFLGISFSDDAVERRNPAVAIALGSVVLANAAIYAGANIGNGPGWWTVVIAAGIGSGAWFLLWLLFQLFCGVADDLTISRDVPAAIRLGGFGLAVGIVCARGAAGDWTSLGQTFVEFAVAWPVLPLAAIAIGIERLLDTRPEHYKRGIVLSIILAALYLAAGLAAVVTAGPLPHNPQFDNLSS